MFVCEGVCFLFVRLFVCLFVFVGISGWVLGVHVFVLYPDVRLYG